MFFAGFVAGRGLLGAGRGLLGAVGLGVRGAEGEAETGGGWVRADGSAGWIQGAVEEERLDPGVIVEPFQVPQVRRGGGYVGVQVRAALPGVRAALPGDLQAVGGGDGGDPEPFGDAAAPGHVGAADGRRHLCRAAAERSLTVPVGKPGRMLTA